MKKIDFVMPEIGVGATIIFSVIALFGGIAIGTQSSLTAQGFLLIAVILLNSCRAVGNLEIGSLSYYIISTVFIVAIIIGDVSYFLQTGVEIHTNFDISNPFKAK